jgi:hypothetical protein
MGAHSRKEGNRLIVETIVLNDADPQRVMRLHIEVQPVREGVQSFDATANTSIPARWSGLVGDAAWVEMWSVWLELQGFGPSSLGSPGT